VLSVGPGARQFSPSQDLPLGKSPHVGNIHYRHLPGYQLGVKTAGSGEALKGNSLSWITPGNVDVTFLPLGRRVESIEEKISMIVGSTGFGRV
jgi:hypothetical protein